MKPIREPPARERCISGVDFELRTVRSVETGVAQRWLEQVLALTVGVAQAKGGLNGAVKEAVLSPDGARLYLLGRTMNAIWDAQGYWQPVQESLGLQVVDIETGRKITDYNTQATRLRMTPDGAYLLLDGWDEDGAWTELLDAQNIEPVTRLTGWETILTRRLDGQPVLLASQPGRRFTQLTILDPHTLEPHHTWSGRSPASWVMPP